MCSRRYWGPVTRPRVATIPYRDLAEQFKADAATRRATSVPARPSLSEPETAVRRRRAWVARLNVWHGFAAGFLAAYSPGRPGGVGP